MAKVRERVEAEFENIERVIAELPNSSLMVAIMLRYRDHYFLRMAPRRPSIFR
jgi:hypothetical protein